MLNKYISKGLYAFLLSTSLLISGCGGNSSVLSEVDLQDLSRYAVTLNNSNRWEYYPLIREKIKKSDNAQLHRDVFEIAMVIDTLAMFYIDGAGGVTQDGAIWNPAENGKKGNAIYENLKVKEKLMGLLSRAKANARPTDKDLLSTTTYIVENKFIGTSPYFDEQKLSERPLSVLSLELLLLENKLCALLLDCLSTAEKKK